MEETRKRQLQKILAKRKVKFNGSDEKLPVFVWIKFITGQFIRKFKDRRRKYCGTKGDISKRHKNKRN